MRRWLGTSLLVLAAVTSVGAQETEAPRRPRIVIQSVEVPGVELHFLSLPWGPETFATMERPEATFYNRRSWPFARLENSVELSLDGTRIAPGNYALVFHPNSAENEGMSLEVLRIDVPEFLRPGNAMTPTPAGESIFRAPVQFDSANSTAPALAIDLAPDEEGVSLHVHYGDRRLVKHFEASRNR